MSPEELEEQQEPASQDNAQEEAADKDSGPLSRMEIEPAENGGAVVTHYPKVSDRVRTLGRHEPKRHVFEDRKKVTEHVKKHIHRVK